jgi:hypothetical protein
MIIPQAIGSRANRAAFFRTPLWRRSLVTDAAGASVNNAPVTPEALTRTVQEFLPGAAVLENGAVAFDLDRAKYSISGEYDRCLLHLWSAWWFGDVSLGR